MPSADEIRPPSSVPYSQTVFIAGPTAIGKSAVALALAERMNGEIISVDSMQVYRGLDIGTAKPTAEERTRIPHHLIDIVDITELFDAAKFCDFAHKAVADIRARGRVPIFCGGTGLYFKAYLEGLGEAPPADEKLRSELEGTPIPDLLKELEAKDPVTFSRIDKQNPRRVIRAIEVLRLTGKPFSEQRAGWGKKVSGAGCQVSGILIGIERGSEDLRHRIDARVDEMFRLGLVEETKKLLDQGLQQNRTAMQAIGYRQVVEHLRGNRSLPETIDLIKTKTRQFAKRQMTWFRGQMELRWIHFNSKDSSEAIAGSFIAGMR